jgi:hypothetical protein
LSFDLKGRDVNDGEGALLRSVSAGSLSLAPSDLPPPIRVSHSMTDGISAYAGEFGGFKVEGDRGHRRKGLRG